MNVIVIYLYKTTRKADECMKIGILGTGTIARKMAATVNAMDNATLEAIGSRTYQKAKAFADEFSIPKAYGSYEELARDNSLDLIYIATPHSRHYEDSLLCLENGRNILGTVFKLTDKTWLKKREAQANPSNPDSKSRPLGHSLKDIISEIDAEGNTSFYQSDVEKRRR